MGKKVVVIDGVLEGWGYLESNDCGDGSDEDKSEEYVFKKYNIF